MKCFAGWFALAFGLLPLASSAALERIEAKTPADVIVGIMAADLPLSRAQESLWTCLPKSAPAPKFSVLTTNDWRGTYDTFAGALVAKAEALKLEHTVLARALAAMRHKEHMAVVPVAAYRGTIGGRPVWVIHLQWEIRPALKMALTKAGPKLEEEPARRLGHLRTYAIALDNLEVVAFETCL